MELFQMIPVFALDVDWETIMVERKTASTRKSPPRKTSQRKKSVANRPSKKGSAKNDYVKKAIKKKSSPARWSQHVTEKSDALDLKQGVFKLRDPHKIAASLKRSAEQSSRRKTGAYRSALSMLTFYINRAGKTLPKTQRGRLEKAKIELKHQFGRD